MNATQLLKKIENLQKNCFPYEGDASSKLDITSIEKIRDRAIETLKLIPLQDQIHYLKLPLISFLLVCPTHFQLPAGLEDSYDLHEGYTMQFNDPRLLEAVLKMGCRVTADDFEKTLKQSNFWRAQHIKEKGGFAITCAQRNAFDTLHAQHLKDFALDTFKLTRNHSETARSLNSLICAQKASTASLKLLFPQLPNPIDCLNFCLNELSSIQDPEKRSNLKSQLEKVVSEFSPISSPI